jgi:hypothetical protein
MPTITLPAIVARYCAHANQEYTKGTGLQLRRLTVEQTLLYMACEVYHGYRACLM